MTLEEFMSTRGSQSLIANKMGVSRQRVNEWVDGKRRPNVTNIIKLTNVLKEFGVNTTTAQVLDWLAKIEKKN